MYWLLYANYKDSKKHRKSITLLYEKVPKIALKKLKKNLKSHLNIY